MFYKRSLYIYITVYDILGILLHLNIKAPVRKRIQCLSKSSTKKKTLLRF